MQHPSLQSQATGFVDNKDWVRTFPWVEEVKGEGMLCRLCRKHNRRPKKAVVGKITWVDIPCVTITQQSLKKHDTSFSHLEAKQLETQLCLSRKDGGIEQAFCVVESAERKAMKAAMMCMYSAPGHMRQ